MHEDPTGELIIRRGVEADRPAILALLQASLDRDDDARFSELFSWKHEQNPFGRSPSWVACAGSTMVGFRALMPWEFERDGIVLRAVRAVDTATHPGWQGRGIFRRLTLGALEELRDEAVDFVFNTPNDKSRPGYLKMGWGEVGRVHVSVRPRSIASLVRIARARVPADRWSQPSRGGVPALEALDDADLAELLAAQRPSPRLRTRVSVGFLRWRYGTPLLGYRAVCARGGVRSGLAIFRVRERGPSREAVLATVLAPGGDPRIARSLARSVAREADADYVIRTGGARLDGFVPLPGQGPVLTWRALGSSDAPPLGQWDLELGDVELF